jgi:ParB family chromosome partitioning protein
MAPRAAPAKPAARDKARAGRSARRGSARKRLTPRAEARGLAAGEVRLDPSHPDVAVLAAEIEAAGGAVLGAYREPLAGRALLLATLPRDAVEPTPFQRDLSPTHAKRLAAKVEESGAFLDPLIVVRGADGGFWTPNGRHRLAAIKLLGLRQVTALVSPDASLAFRILALNTEKAHNLRDRSLEVIRMARALAKREPRRREVDYATELESAELLTLGLVYERESRFAGGAYAPMLRRVDRFSTRTLPASLRERQGWAARLIAVDARVKELVAALQRRGMRSPYLRNLVVARIDPVRFRRAKKGDTKPVMPLPEALTRMAANARRFDPSSVRGEDVALVAALARD